jgi:hypothetical protein
MQFQVTITIQCQMLTYCMNISYLIDSEQMSSLLFQCVVYFVGTDNIFIWMCKVLCTI